MTDAQMSGDSPSIKGRTRPHCKQPCARLHLIENRRHKQLRNWPFMRVPGHSIRFTEEDKSLWNCVIMLWNYLALICLVFVSQRKFFRNLGSKLLQNNLLWRVIGSNLGSFSVSIVLITRWQWILDWDKLQVFIQVLGLSFPPPPTQNPYLYHHQQYQQNHQIVLQVTSLMPGAFLQ